MLILIFFLLNSMKVEYFHLHVSKNKLIFFLIRPICFFYNFEYFYTLKFFSYSFPPISYTFEFFQENAAACLGGLEIIAKHHVLQALMEWTVRNIANVFTMVNAVSTMVSVGVHQDGLDSIVQKVCSIWFYYLCFFFSF